VSARNDLRDVAERLVRDALAAGARAADAVVGESDGLSVGVRLGEVEKLKRARERRAGLRVFVGDSTAIVSTADLSAHGLADLAQERIGELEDVFGPIPQRRQLDLEDAEAVIEVFAEFASLHRAVEVPVRR